MSLDYRITGKKYNDIISRKSSDEFNAMEATEKVSYSLANLLTFISASFNNMKSSVILDVRLDVMEAFLEAEYVESFNDDIYASMLVVLDSLFLPEHGADLSNELEIYLIRILIQIEYSSSLKSLKDRAAQILSRIAQFNYNGTDLLCNMHYDSLINFIFNSHDSLVITGAMNCLSIEELELRAVVGTWTRLHPRCLLFSGYLRYLWEQSRNHTESLVEIFVSLLHPDSNSELRIYMLALFDELLGLKEFTEGLVQKAWKIME